MRCKAFHWIGHGPFIRAHWCQDCGGVMMPHAEARQENRDKQTNKELEKLN